jgi:hypothetical protein
MKNNLIIGVLVGMLSLSAVIALVLSFRVITASRELTVHQTKIVMINNDRTVAENLYNDLVEYGKTHPSIQPILTQFGPKSNPTAAPANR